MESDPDRSGELDARTRRLREALSRAAVASGLVETSPAPDAKGERALRKGLRRYLRDGRRWRRGSSRDDEGLPQAIVFGGAAAVMVVLVLGQPWVLWWLIFPAFGFGMAAAGILTKWARRRREEMPRSGRVEVTLVRPAPLTAAPKQDDDPAVAAIAARLARVDEACDRLLADLKASPQAVRELIRKPEETVEALRAASAELGRRERDLRTAVSRDGDERLRSERSGLEARVSAETDDVVRGRLSEAIGELDQQLEERRDLLRTAARIEAEGTRILYSLESLRARVLRVRAADVSASDAGGEGLREGLEQLSREMDAVATALEEVHAAGTVRRQMPIPQAARG